MIFNGWIEVPCLDHIVGGDKMVDKAFLVLGTIHYSFSDCPS